MVTDSGANFIKAFKHFSLDEAEEMATEESEVTDINNMAGRSQRFLPR